MRHYKQYVIVTKNEMNQHSDSHYDSVRASYARAMARLSSALTGPEAPLKPSFLQNPDSMTVSTVKSVNDTKKPAKPLIETSAQESTDPLTPEKLQKAIEQHNQLESKRKEMEAQLTKIHDPFNVHDGIQITVSRFTGDKISEILAIEKKLREWNQLSESEKQWSKPSQRITDDELKIYERAHLAKIMVSAKALSLPIDEIKSKIRSIGQLGIPTDSDFSIYLESESSVDFASDKCTIKGEEEMMLEAEDKQHMKVIVHPVEGAKLNNSNIYDAVAMWCSRDVDEKGVSPLCNKINENLDTDKIGEWDTSGVTNMRKLFRGRSEFNDDIGGWNVKNVTDTSYMFSDARMFFQNLSQWKLSNVVDVSYMFQSTGNCPSYTDEDEIEIERKQLEFLKNLEDWETFMRGKKGISTIFDKMWEGGQGTPTWFDTNENRRLLPNESSKVAQHEHYADSDSD